MATFVLVHGAWSGAHGWRAVRRALAADGHDVFTPSLTGIGERVHLVGPQIGLATHVQDVVNQILFEDLEQVVLVGFSYGGAVVTGAVAHVHERIRELVYLDAFVPRDGETVAGLSGREPPTEMGLGADWLVPPPQRHFDDAEEGRWQDARRVPQPARCFTEPVHVPRPLEEHGFGLTYVKATADGRDAPGGDAFWDAAEHARRSSRWRLHELATTHMAASNRPQELAALLAAIAAGDA